MARGQLSGSPHRVSVVVVLMLLMSVGRAPLDDQLLMLVGNGR